MPLETPFDIGSLFSGGMSGAGPDQPDPAASLVEDLFKNFETAPKPQTQKVGPLRTILGTLGDALIMAGRARAGQGGPSMGPFATSMMALREQEAEAAEVAEAEARALRNKIRIADFESKRAALIKSRAPVDLDSTTEDILGTQDIEGIPPDAVGQPIRARISSDPATGKVTKRVFIGRKSPDDLKSPKTKDFPGMITKAMAIDDPSLAPHVGETWMMHAVIDDESGAFKSVKPTVPVGDRMQFIETESGFVGVSPRTGQVKPIIDPATEDRIVSHAAAMKEIEIRNKEKADLLGKELETGPKNDIAFTSTGIEAASYAMRRFHELGGPQLVMGSQWVTSEEAKQARSAIAAAVVPIRKWLFGAALTPEERESADDILTDLSSGVHPDRLEANMVELANMMWRSRRITLETEQKAGRNVSKFAPEMKPVLFRNSNDLMFGFEMPDKLTPEQAAVGKTESRTKAGKKIVVVP